MLGAYLAGIPGSGKSSLLAALSAGVPVSWMTRPFAHALYTGPGGDPVLGAQLGGLHPAFPGTDRLSMGVQPLAIDWVSGAPVPLLVGEGDRLATAGFLNAFAAACDVFTLVLLDVPADVAASRRAIRGSHQSESWVKGRATKVSNLVSHRSHVVLDGTLAPPDLLAAAVRSVPAFAALRSLAV